MKDGIIRKVRYIWQLECGQKWKLGVRKHRRSVRKSEQGSPSLPVVGAFGHMASDVAPIAGYLEHREDFYLAYLGTIRP